MDLIGLAALKLVKKYKTSDPFKIAQQRNVVIRYVKLGPILGYHNTYHRVSIIHINSDLDEMDQKFVCAHELGHSVLHKNVNTPFLRKNTYFSVDRIEREANKFAICLLTHDKKIAYGETIECFYARNGIPKELIHLNVPIVCESADPYIF